VVVNARPADGQTHPHTARFRALDGASYDNLLDGGKASLIFTDPPYNVTIDGNVGGKGLTRPNLQPATCQ
jgi:hypothetical protein